MPEKYRRFPECALLLIPELMFRPEDVEIVVDGGAGADMLGAVISTFFMGDRTRLLVEIGLERPIVVETRRRAYRIARVRTCAAAF